MHPSPPPGPFEVFVALVTLFIGLELAQLLAPTLIAMIGWGFGAIGAILIRKVEYRAVPFLIFTFGVTVGGTVPLAVLAAPYAGDSATALLLPIGVAIPFAGDKLLALLERMMPDRIKRLMGRDQ